MLQAFKLAIQGRRQAAAEFRVIRGDIRDFRLPAGDVHREQLFLLFGGEVQTGQISASGVGTLPTGVFSALPVPSMRSQIHFRTREFSP